MNKKLSWKFNFFNGLCRTNFENFFYFPSSFLTNEIIFICHDWPIWSPLLFIILILQMRIEKFFFRKGGEGLDLGFIDSTQLPPNPKGWSSLFCVFKIEAFVFLENFLFWERVELLRVLLSEFKICPYTC